MATSYPASADDDTTLPDPTAVNKTNSPSHSSLHANANGAIKAIEAKLGTGASTPVANRLLFGNGTGTSTWAQLTSAQLAASLSDETGSGSAVFSNTPTLVTPKVDTINEATSGNGVSIDGVLLKDAKMNGSYITDGSVASPQLATGVVVQIAATNYSAMATGTTTIPYDDTIPQNTEGVEFMTQSITPKSATNRLFIEVDMWMAISSNGQLIGALFQDSTANALSASSVYTNNFSGNGYRIRVAHDMVAGTTSSTTFKVRGGSEVAGTWTFNGTAGARKFGGITLSTIRITEYKA